MPPFKTKISCKIVTFVFWVCSWREKMAVSQSGALASSGAASWRKSSPTRTTLASSSLWIWMWKWKPSSWAPASSLYVFPLFHLGFGSKRVTKHFPFYLFIFVALFPYDRISCSSRKWARPTSAAPSSPKTTNCCPSATFTTPIARSTFAYVASNMTTWLTWSTCVAQAGFSENTIWTTRQ